MRICCSKLQISSNLESTHPHTQLMSMASLHIKLAFFFFALTVAQLSFTCATPIFETDPHRILRGLFPKTHIYINNTLGGGQQAKVHCKAIYADKGEQVINDGETYEFGFTPSFIRTLWQCDFSFVNGTVSGPIYQYTKDWSRCFKHCRYSIAKDGVHGYNEDGQEDLFLQWGNQFGASYLYYRHVNWTAESLNHNRFGVTPSDSEAIGGTSCQACRTYKNIELGELAGKKLPQSSPQNSGYLI
ncbi:hypothetical protein Cgig2_013957 [Carnegiea gigantea]|uniref:S-protein homolog n=1 Tax=Carnegiea gigantea TaxID=171969 RepID=A0A9Q1QSZ3_9CARY|nr:hypothetical protein Cgig2_013957 [Carnegiea gigantea]